MTCEESIERMSELLDGFPSELLEAHLGACPSCREGLEAMRRADEALRRHPSLEWTSAMTEGILRRAKRPALRLVPIAACLAAAAAATILLLPRDPEIPREALTRHVSAVRCMAEQDGLETLDRDILSCQVRQLALPDLTARLSTSPALAAYVEECSRPLETPADVSRLWGCAREIQSSCGLSIAPARIAPVPDPTPADLYAAGRLHFSNGDSARAVRALDALIERQPDGPYADPTCVALAGHFAGTGDDVSALAFYASIRNGQTITPEIARSIQETGRRAGRAFAGPRPLAEADVEALRRCAEARTPYGLVCIPPGQRPEYFVLGPVGLESAIPSEATFSCPSLRTRKIKIDLPPDRVTDPVVREMLKTMEEFTR